MAKNKLRKFQDITEFSNVYEYLPPIESDFEFKGAWHTEVFQNDYPITLELACGKGEYAVGLARRKPEGNYIGIDIKGSRIWNGAKEALEAGIEQVRYLRMYIDHVNHAFGLKEISDIWIIFPDPFLKESDERKRLTSPKFLDLYRAISTDDCRINLKTDSPELYTYTKQVIAEQGLTLHRDVEDIYENAKDDDVLVGIQTYYEMMHLEEKKKIYFLSFDLFPKP